MSLDDPYIDEDALSEAGDKHLENECRKSDVLCPKSGKPVEEFPEGWFFPGYEEAAFPKEICGRKMSAEDYVAVLRGGNTGASFEKFYSKSKERNFAARLRYNPSRVFEEEVSPGVEFYFPPDKETGAICPKSGQPVTETEKAFKFAGFPGFFGKVIAGRNMSAEDYVKILAAGNSGVKIEGFRSKKTGSKFGAVLKYNPNRMYDGKSAPGVEFVLNK